jgi:hypothetical protein
MNVNGISNNTEQQSADSSQTKSPCAHFYALPSEIGGWVTPICFASPELHQAEDR